jgi:hypothetical protein
VRNIIGMIPLIEGDGHLGPSEPRRGGKGVNSVHLLLSDTALSVGFIRLGALEDQEAAIDLRELSVILRGNVAGSLAFGASLWALPYWPRVPWM